MNNDEPESKPEERAGKIPLKRLVSQTALNRREFKLNEHYGRLEAVDGQNPRIACPLCTNMQFMIGYGEYECIAFCPCGHKMVVYDG